MSEHRLIKSLDFTLIFVIIAILTMSLVAIYSANVASATEGGDPYNYVKKQLLWIALGTIIILVILNFDYEDFKGYSNHLYFFNLAILLLVIFAGDSALGAQRWIDIGPFRFQPSEFAKVLVIMTFANFLANRKDKLNTFWELVPAFFYVGIPMLLILKQPDLGTSLVFVAIMFGMLFIAGANPLLVGGLFTGGVATAILWVYLRLNYGIWIPLKDYQLERLTIFLDPFSDPWGAGYHIIQSLVAIGSGESWGKGYLEGTQNQLNFLPEQHTDFIFSVIGEEFGFIGAIVLLFLFFMFVYRSLLIAGKAKDMYGTLLVTGVISMFVFQIFVNIGMTTAIMPVTGLPLPLVTYGGSSMLTNMIGIGLIINVSLRRQQLTF